MLAKVNDMSGVRERLRAKYLPTSCHDPGVRCIRPWAARPFAISTWNRNRDAGGRDEVQPATTPALPSTREMDFSHVWEIYQPVFLDGFVGHRRYVGKEASFSNCRDGALRQ